MKIHIPRCRRGSCNNGAQKQRRHMQQLQRQRQHVACGRRSRSGRKTIAAKVH